MILYMLSPFKVHLIVDYYLSDAFSCITRLSCVRCICNSSTFLSSFVIPSITAMQLSVLLNSNKTSKTTQDPSNCQKATSSISALYTLLLSKVVTSPRLVLVMVFYLTKLKLSSFLQFTPRCRVHKCWKNSNDLNLR